MKVCTGDEITKSLKVVLIGTYSIGGEGGGVRVLVHGGKCGGVSVVVMGGGVSLGVWEAWEQHEPPPERVPPPSRTALIYTPGSTVAILNLLVIYVCLLRTRLQLFIGVTNTHVCVFFVHCAD